jgi:hypothetical protein
MIKKLFRNNLEFDSKQFIYKQITIAFVFKKIAHTLVHTKLVKIAENSDHIFDLGRNFQI